MYERGVGADGKMVLTDNDTKNPATSRAMVDDLITIPDDWGQAHPFSQRRRLHKAFHATGATNSSPKSMDDAGRPTFIGSKEKGYSTTNKGFKPKAKQVFAALYYPWDTFYMANSGTKTQATFNTIGALVERAGIKLQDAFWASCYNRQKLADTNDGDLLVEAHLFKQLKISEDVQDLVLSRMRKDSDPAWTDAQWMVIIANATKWCKRNHVRLIFASP